MKKLITSLILMIFSLYIVLAQQPPIPPHQFYGDVLVNSNIAPDGLMIEALIENQTFSSITTEGRYGVIPNTLKIPFEPERENKLIEFFIVGEGEGCREKASQNATFESGDIEKLDLTFNLLEACFPKQESPPPNNNPGNNGDGSSSGGSSSGGGSSGGRGRIIINKPTNETITVETIACTSSWKCSDWLDCAGTLQKRVCTDVNSCGTDEGKPEEERSCLSNELTQSQTPFISKLLGAVIGPEGKIKPFGAIIFVALIVAITFIVIFIRKQKPMKK